jgi:hypothetical protein
MKALSALAFLVLSAGLVFGQVSRDQRRAENATEAESGIYDTVDIVSGPAVEQVTAHSVVLRWRTNKVAATRVNYGFDPNSLYQHAYQPGGSIEHGIELHNLRSGTTYYFAIENKHGQGRLTGTFQTQ